MNTDKDERAAFEKWFAQHCDSSGYSDEYQAEIRGDCLIAWQARSRQVQEGEASKWSEVRSPSGELFVIDRAPDSWELRECSIRPLHYAGMQQDIYEDVYYQLAGMIEPYVSRPTNPDGPLPASVTEALQIVFQHWLESSRQSPDPVWAERHMAGSKQLVESVKAELGQQSPAPASTDPCKDKCQYAADIGMPESHCDGGCQYANHPDYAASPPSSLGELPPPRISLKLLGLLNDYRHCKHEKVSETYLALIGELEQNMKQYAQLCIAGMRDAEKEAVAKWNTRTPAAVQDGWLPIESAPADIQFAFISGRIFGKADMSMFRELAWRHKGSWICSGDDWKIKAATHYFDLSQLGFPATNAPPADSSGSVDREG